MPDLKVGDIVMMEYYGYVWDGKIAEINMGWGDPPRNLAMVQWRYDQETRGKISPAGVQEIFDLVPLD